MEISRHKSISSKWQYTLASSEPSSLTTINHGYPNTPEKLDANLKFHVMKTTEFFKEDIDNQLKEIQTHR